MSRSDEDRYRMAWMVVVGVRAAKEVRKRLNRLSKSPDEHFLRMSLDLNLQQLTEKERDDFAHTLYQLTKHSAARPSDIRPVDFELDRVLSDYCQSSSIQSLLSGVQSLKCRFI